MAGFLCCISVLLLLQIEKQSFNNVDIPTRACQHRDTNSIALAMCAEHEIARPRFACAMRQAPNRHGRARRSRLHDSLYAHEFAGNLQMRRHFAADVLLCGREWLSTGMSASKACTARIETASVETWS
ncbi:MAG TPA: hypothetical protein VHM01_03155 [Alphaproteobacteria bacterium]|nr:hypothetical protein [Alphaproteobacteria bacterium]